jgi:glycerophosphoryl diester phosphodiesterase
VAIIAHRGASGHAPEHTFAAYDRAVELGADYLEQDLQVTADGELVVLHDATLDRTTDGGGRVDERTLAEVKALDAGAWFGPGFAGQRVLTLDEVLTRYGHAQRYYIETKAPDIEARLVALLDSHGLLEAGHWQVLIQSFEPAHLRRIRELAPRLPLIQLVSHHDPALLARLDEVSAYAAGIGPSRALVDAPLVTEAHARGLAVHPYTADDPEELARLVGLGVDGVFTNRPERLAAVRG